jgi:hypothetical protein
MIVPRGIFGVALTILVRIEHARSGTFKPPEHVPSRDGMCEVSSLSSSAEQQQLGRARRGCNSGRYPPQACLALLSGEDGRGGTFFAMWH